MKDPFAQAIPGPDMANEKLIGLVKGIIEKKIESLELQEEYLFISYEQIDQSYLQNQIPAPGKLKAIKEQLDSFIEKLEIISYARKLLRDIYRALAVETVRSIFFLLHNDKYLFYNKETLDRMLHLERVTAGGYMQLSPN